MWEKKTLSNYSFKLSVMNTLEVREYRQTIPVRWLRFYSFIKLKGDKEKYKIYNNKNKNL